MRNAHFKRDDEELKRELESKCDTEPELGSEPDVPLPSVEHVWQRLSRYRARREKWFKNKTSVLFLLQIDRQSIADDARRFEEKALRDRGVRHYQRGSAGRADAESRLAATFGRVWWHESCSDCIRRGLV